MAPGGDVPSRPLLSPRVVLFGVLLPLAALVRLLFSGEKSFRLDEAATVAIVRLDWATFLDVVVNQEANMALYYGLLRFWVGLGGSEFVIRSLSVILAVATLPVLYALGTRLFGARVGLVATLLLTLNAMHITYSQKARGYSLLVLLVTLSSLFFLRSIERPSRKNWVGYILASVLGVYAHFFGALVLVGQWVSLVFLRPRDVPWRGLLWSTLVIGILLLPLGVFVVTQDVGQVEGLTEPGLRRFLGVFNALAGGDGKLLLPVYFIFCSIALLAAAREWRSSPASFGAWRYAVLLTWLFVPIVLARAVSFAKPIFAVRFLSICLPPLALLAAIGLSRLRPRWAFVGALAVVVSLAAGGVISYYRSPEWEDWRGAAEHVRSQARSGDATVFYVAKVRVAFENYQARVQGSSRNPAVAFPSQWEWSMLVTERMQAPSPALLDSLPGRYERVWLILSHDHVRRSRGVISNSIQASLAGKFPSVKEREFVGVRVLLYSKTPGD